MDRTCRFCGAVYEPTTPKQIYCTDRCRIDTATAIRKAGLRVFDTAALGDGFPDLVVVRPDGTVRLVEIKSDITSGASKIANEVEVMVSLVSNTYRIVDNVDQAIDACLMNVGE